MVAVRPASPSDAGAWLRMRCGLWPDENADELGREIAEFFAGSLSEPEAVLLATGASDGALAAAAVDAALDVAAANSVLGFVELSIRPTAEGCRTSRIAYVEAWYVAREARGRGVGRALIRAAEDWGRAQGCEELASDTEIENAASAAAHRALGFEDAGVVRCFRKELRREGENR